MQSGRGGRPPGFRPPEPPVIAGRVPPHDLDAEAAVLSAILLKHDALDQVVEFLKSEHFYSEANGRIYEAAMELAALSQPIDTVTVASWLRDRERLQQVGGAAYLAQVVDATPAVAHVAAHARTVREKWRLRRVIAECQRIGAEGYGDVGDAQEFIDGAEQAIYALARTPEASAAQPIQMAIKAAFKQMQEAAARGDKITGASTGFAKLDEKTAGLHDGDLMIIAARPGMGKCLAADAEVVLDDGRVATMREVFEARRARLLTVNAGWKLETAEPSDYIDDGIKPVFRVTTRLGRQVDTTLTHPFLTVDGWRPLGELAVGDHVGVPRVLPVFGDRPMRDCNVRILGCLLGDGAVPGSAPTITSTDPRLLEELAADFREVGEGVVFQDRHRRPASSPMVTSDGAVVSVERGRARAAVPSRPGEAGPWTLDLVPAPIFQLPREQLALFLDRLFATCGWATVLPSGEAQLGCVASSEPLARQLQHLLLRFGVIAALRAGSSRDPGALDPGWRIEIEQAASICTFAETIGMRGKEAALWACVEAASARKRHDNGEAGAEGRTRGDVYFDEIVSIEPLGLRQVYDLTIPGTHNFVANDVCVHNTSFVLNLAVNIASPRTVSMPGPADRGYGRIEKEVPGYGVAIFTLEMPREQIATRMVCCEGRVDVGKVRSGMLNQDDWRHLTESASYLSTLPIWVDDTPAIGLLEVRAKVRRMKAEFERAATETDPERKMGCVVIDYLQLMSGRPGVNSREQEISEISRGLKQLAKELRVPVIALSQLNRAVETRAGKDKRPQLSDLRESGAIEQDADAILFIYRDEYYNPETTDRRGIAELILAKQRNGPTGKVLVKFTSSCTRFDSLQPGDYDALMSGDDD